MLEQKEMSEEKALLTTKEAAAYLGISVSYVHKLTFRKEIPYYKPSGKMCFFEKADLDHWVRRNRVATDEELTSKAQAYCMQKGGLK